MRHGTLVNDGGDWQEEKKVLNEIIICVFFAHKKYSHRFIKLFLLFWLDPTLQ